MRPIEMKNSKFRLFMGLLTAGMAIAAAGCGYKSDLKPPEPRRVERVSGLEAKITCDGIRLEWGPALFDTRGNPLEEPATYLVYRKRGAPVEQDVKKTVADDDSAGKSDPADAPETGAGDANGTGDNNSDMPAENETGNNSGTAPGTPDDRIASDIGAPPPDPDLPVDGDETGTGNEKLPDIPGILPQEYEFGLVAVVPGKPVALTTTRITGERIEWIDTGAPSGPSYRPGTIKYRIPERSADVSADPDDGLVPGYMYTYSVIAVDASSVTSMPSDVVNCPWVPIPAPPEHPAVTVSRNRVDLSWEKPGGDCTGNPLTDVVQYEIVRADASTSDRFKRLFTVSADEELAITDDTVAMDTTYYYKIRAVITETIAGEWTDIITADTTNVFPPPPPTHLTGAVRPVGVFLNWRAGTDDNIAGYRVYRTSTKQQEYDLLNPDMPVAGTVYVDETAVKGDTYTYRVTSVDNSANANESEPGNTWSVTIR
jgi:hypothetical protein